MLNTTFQTTPPTPDDLTPLPSATPSADYFFPSSTSTDSAPVSPVVPIASTSSTSFFGRLRSNSLHSSVPTTRSSLRRSASPPPPMPAFPSTPYAASSSASLRYDYLSRSGSPHGSHVPCPPIKSVTIPHLSKAGKRPLYACRVVPEAPELDSCLEKTVVGRSHARRESLGRMSLAGEGEPHTVWRTWQEFVDFGSKLATAFPDKRPITASPTSSPAASTLYHQVPRLNNKRVLFMKDSVLAQRQAELEQFCRHLFRMPREVKQSALVRDFFRVRDDAALLNPSAMSSASSLHGGDAPLAPPPALNVPEDWLAGDPNNDLELPSSPNATVKASKPKPPRPSLAIKISSPNLRSAIRGFGSSSNIGAALAEDEVAYSPSPLSRGPLSAAPTLGGDRPLLVNRAMADIVELPRPDSKCSTATTSSSVTVTPATAPVPAKSVKKKRSGPLRHFRSLQDLRGSSKSSAAPEVPDEPVPSLAPAFAAAAMARAATQPLTSSRRSSKSSTSSVEDLWGTPFPSFRQTTSGRVEAIPQGGHGRPSVGGALSGRAASFGPASSSSSLVRPPLTRGAGGHNSSASISSIGSTGSAGSSSALSRSGRSSFDWSVSGGAGSEFCPTPPTPQTEWQGMHAAAGKYYVENGVLLENNMVPPPPFFPVPPPMQFAYSHDGFPHTPRSTSSSHTRKSSSELALASSRSRSRSRTGSTASSRMGGVRSSLDPILASPAASSAASSPRTSSGHALSWTFKLLHRSENVVLRVSKPAYLGADEPASLPLEQLRSEVEAKFKASGVVLADCEWGLGWSTKPAGGVSATSQDGPTVTKLIVQQEDLERCLREHEAAGVAKIVLKVIC
ncbi:hypothetical protein JCM10213v2_002341 [Rhodosporidiobolus nylandii]